MTTQQISTNPTCNTNVTIRESDKYSQNVFVKFTSGQNPNNQRGCHEMWLTVDELDNLAKILKESAEKIRTQQNKRHSEDSM